MPDSFPKLKICIVGCGAIGSLYGGKLSQAGHEIDIVARTEITQIQKSGIQIESVWGNFIFHPDKVWDSIESCKSNYYDLVLISLKALPKYQTPEFVKKISPLLSPQGGLLIIQNGLNVEIPFAEIGQNHPILSGLAFVCVNRITPTLIRHIDFGRIILGTYSGKSEPIMAALLHSLESVGVPVKPTLNLIEARWAKLIWNIAFNPMSVIGNGATTDTLLNLPESKHICEMMMKETYTVAQKLGIKLPEDIIQKNLADTLKMPPYKTSMLLDYEQKRPMEVEAICGELVRTAHSLNIPIPHIETIYGILKLISIQNNLDS